MEASVKFDESRWAWWAGRDEESYQVGPCATRAEAIEAAINDGAYVEVEPGDVPDDWTISLHVVEAVRPEVADMTIDGDRLLEDLECGPYEDWSGEDGLFDLGEEEVESLSQYLTSALHIWAQVHGVRFKTWMFADTRNEERVVLPHPLPAEE